MEPTSIHRSPSLDSADDDEIMLWDMSRQRSNEYKRSSRKTTGWMRMMAEHSRILSWLYGPSSPQRIAISPTFPRLQDRLQALQATWLPGGLSHLAAAVIFLVWLITFSRVLVQSSKVDPSLSKGQQPVRLACDTRLWPNTTACGLDGRNCAPFEGHGFTFLCPSNCASVHVLEPHFVGDQEIIYDTMVIGGLSSDGETTNTYRGDSFICQAAIHAGIFSNARGGCGMLKRNGEHGNFAASLQNGISSIEFLPKFPLSYTLSIIDARCDDPQWKLFAISLVATALLSLLPVPSLPFVASIFTIVFFQIALASDKPFYPDDASTLSKAFENLLPTVFVVFVMYQFCIRYTLHGLQGRLEQALFWLGGCWVSALNNYTFDRLPISRLTAHDLRQQPGAITALVIIVVVIATAGVSQALAFRKEGRLLSYIGGYLGFGLLLGFLAAIPNLQFRLHHYIIGLILLPGTSVQTRRSLLYQGLLFGLFINGIARWGYASILQTAEALREDGLVGSALPQAVRSNLIDLTSLQFTIAQLAQGFDGISVLVNDVERHQDLAGQAPFVFNWTRNDNGPTFFRFAYTATAPLGGIVYGDYTKPVIWHTDGT